MVVHQPKVVDLLNLSYFGLAFTFLALAGEEIRLSQPVVAVICWIKKVYVADEHLEVEITQHIDTSLTLHS